MPVSCPPRPRRGCSASPARCPMWRRRGTSRRRRTRWRCAGIPDSGERRLDLLRWGLVPHFTKDLKAARRPINARAETVATSGMFRGGAGRTALPRAGGRVLRMARAGRRQAALRDRPAGRPANGLRRAVGGLAVPRGRGAAQLRHRHDHGERDAAAAARADAGRAGGSRLAGWLGEAAADPLALLRPAADDVLHVWPVGRRVGNVRNNDAELLAPVEAAAAG